MGGEDFGDCGHGDAGLGEWWVQWGSGEYLRGKVAQDNENIVYGLNRLQSDL